ncbi:hypothetical protein D6C86_05638 [Aureobasidium pullulans]|nr:hypothetical protein D6C88_09444 [Aureobasidium pullulans]THZ59469.1 hypothetical protein D6C86_05638 [Aureobasidium pullulans]
MCSRSITFVNMHRAVTALVALAALTGAQSTSTIDVDAIVVPAPSEVFVLPVVYVTAENAPAVTATTLTGTATAASDPLATNVFDSKGDVAVALSSASVLATATTPDLSKRAATCVPQPSGIAYSSVPDSAAGFVADTYYNSQAVLASVPTGWVQSFAGINASNSADKYMGFSLLTSYDPKACMDKCTAVSGCNSVNIYFERDPSTSVDASCSNPPSVVNVKCVLWGGVVATANANNFGQLRGDFQVLIAGSAGYMKSAFAAALAAQPSATSSLPSTATDGADNVYNIYASSDSTQGSYTNAQALTSYKDCMDFCDNDSKCNAWTYVGGTNGLGPGSCWLKSKLGSPSPAGANVVSGSKNGKVTTTYSTTDPTSTPFYIKISRSGTSADNKYIFISSANGQSKLVSNPADATKFVVNQRNNYMLAQTGSAAGLAFALGPTTSATSPLYFAKQGVAAQSYFSCAVQPNGDAACSVNGVGIAGTVCAADNYSSIQLITGGWPSSCLWVLWSFISA